MILESVEHGPLIWPTVKENGVIKTNKYAELSVVEKIQADCDMKATNIILQGFAVPVFSPRDDPIACLNKAMAFLTVGDKGKIILVLLIRTMLQVQGEILQLGRQELLNVTTAKVNDIWLGNALSLSDQGISRNSSKSSSDSHSSTIVAFPMRSCYFDSDCDVLSNAQAGFLMANISNYGSDVISEEPNSKTYLNDMDNQSVLALQDFEQSPVLDFIDNEISSDSNIIPYS
ncbi:hypothetical protein Tco_0852603 [Tanacetum coccineum]